MKRAADLYRKRLKQPHLVQAAMDRLVPDVAGNGVAKADLVIEAIVENAEVKRKLFASIEPPEGAALSVQVMGDTPPLAMRKCALRGGTTGGGALTTRAVTTETNAVAL